MVIVVVATAAIERKEVKGKNDSNKVEKRSLFNLVSGSSGGNDHHHDDEGGHGGGGGSGLFNLPYLASSASSSSSHANHNHEYPSHDHHHHEYISHDHHEYIKPHYIPVEQHAEIPIVGNHLFGGDDTYGSYDHHEHHDHHLPTFEELQSSGAFDDDHHFEESAHHVVPDHEYSNLGGDLSHFSDHAGILDVSYDSYGHELGLFFPQHTSYHHLH